MYTTTHILDAWQLIPSSDKIIPLFIWQRNFDKQDTSNNQSIGIIAWSRNAYDMLCRWALTLSDTVAIGKFTTFSVPARLPIRCKYNFRHALLSKRHQLVNAFYIGYRPLPLRATATRRIRSFRGAIGHDEEQGIYSPTLDDL